jgi:Fe-Mn family superoxide dismutase
MVVVAWVVCVVVGVGGDETHVENMLSEIPAKYQETYTVPKLPYKYDAYEPWLDAKTVEAHHQQVHKERVFNMNKLLKEWRKSNSTPEISKLSLLGILKNIEKVPDKWREGLRNNIGGYVNHILTFAILSPNPKGEERNLSKVMTTIFKRSFGKKTNFEKMFNKTSREVFGNGYIWMCRVPQKRYLTIFTGLEERNPLSANGMQPILGIDLWEHAYWAKYGNNRDDYIRAWWHLVDYDKVEQIMDWWDKLDNGTHAEL